MVRPQTADMVKEFLSSNGLTFDVVIDNLQSAIDTENPTMTPEEMEELEGRKGTLFKIDTSVGILTRLQTAQPKNHGSVTNLFIA
jgi:hypothetical protein